MATEIVKYEELTPEELMAMTGQSTGKKFNDFPRLSINSDGEDDAGRAIPIGAYMVSQGGLAVFGKPITFRPFINAYQYAVYEPEKKNYTNRSVIFKNFSEEAPDELGGIACGKISKKNHDGLTAEQLDFQKKIKCYRYLYGVVTFNGVSADGQKHDLVELPVRARLSGSNFMPISEAIEFLEKKKVPMITANVELTTKREKFGTNSYYVMVAKADVKNVVDLTEKDWTLLKDFISSIDRENQTILEKYKAAKGVTSREVVQATDIAKELESDFYDDSADLKTIIQ